MAGVFDLIGLTRSIQQIADEVTRALIPVLGRTATLIPIDACNEAFLKGGMMPNKTLEKTKSLMDVLVRMEPKPRDEMQVRGPKKRTSKKSSGETKSVSKS